MTREEAIRAMQNIVEYWSSRPTEKEAAEMAIEALRQMPCEKNDPLTLDELRQMNGQPVWIDQENAWGFVAVDEVGLWAGKPFVVFRYKCINCNYDVEMRGLKCYRRKPEVQNGL